MAAVFLSRLDPEAMERLTAVRAVMRVGLRIPHPCQPARTFWVPKIPPDRSKKRASRSLVERPLRECISPVGNSQKKKK